MSELGEAARSMWDNGLRVIPLKPRGKKPLIAWKEFQEREPTEEEIESWWTKWPDANVGVVTGVNCIVVDADTNDTIRWISDNLPPTPWKVKTARGAHFYYGINGVVPNSVNEKGKVDIRGRGGYVVAPPSVHPSGKLYQWKIDSGCMITMADELPPLPQENLSTIYSYNGTDSSGEYIFDAEQVREPHDGSPVAEGGRNNALASMVGQYVAKGDDILSVVKQANEWNNQNDNPLMQAEVDATVASILKSHIENNPSEAIPVAIEEVAIPEFDVPDTDLDERVFPSKFLNVPGALGAVCHFINSTAIYPQPILALAAALPVLGTLYGRYYRSKTNLRTNIYTVGIGYSGSGKEHPMHCADQIFTDIGQGDRIGTGRMSSAQGLLKHVQKNPATMMSIDEFGLFLKSVTDGRAATYRKDIMTTLMELFGRSKGMFRGMQYADTDGNRPRIDIYQPCVSVYGTTTPSHFYESLKSTQVMDGFLNRLIIFDIGGHMPEMNIPDDLNPPAGLLKYFEQVTEYIRTKQGVTVSSGVKDIELHTLDIDDDAQEYLTAYAKRMRTKMVDSRQTGMDPMWSRAYEHAVKVSMVRAIGLDYRQPRISLEDITWGCELIEYLINVSIADVVERVADTDYERKLKTVLQFIPKRGIKSSDLTRKTQAISRDERNRIIKDLIDSRRIEQKQVRPKKGRPSIVYNRTK